MLRSFGRQDQDEVRELILSGLKQRWGNEYDDTHNSDLDDITASYVDRGADVVIIER